MHTNVTHDNAIAFTTHPCCTRLCGAPAAGAQIIKTTVCVERSRRRAVALLPANRAALKHIIGWPGSKKAGRVSKSHCAPRQFVQPTAARPRTQRTTARVATRPHVQRLTADDRSTADIRPVHQHAVSTDCAYSCCAYCRSSHNRSTCRPARNAGAAHGRQGATDPGLRASCEQ